MPLRLRRATFMENLPRAANKHFNMGGFFIDNSDDHAHQPPTTPADLLHSCGTTVCAMGWAATMPYFRKRGCKFNKSGTLRGLSVIVPSGTTKWRKLFGGWNDDSTPKQWAKRARNLVREWEVE